MTHISFTTQIGTTTSNINDNQIKNTFRNNNKNRKQSTRTNKSSGILSNKNTYQAIKNNKQIAK